MRTIAALLLLVTPTLGDNCRKQQVVITSTGQAITAFAVPVAVPVATVVQGYAYSHAGAQGYGARVAAADAEYQEFLAWKAAKANQVTTQTVPQTLLQQNCVGCHTPGNKQSAAAAVEKFDMSKELTAEQKLAASRSLLKGTMPKGRTIDDSLRGNLLGELLGVEEK